MQRGIFWSVLASVLGALGALLVTPTLVRTLGPLEFGVYSLVLSLVSYGAFLDFGLTWAAGRYFAEDIIARDSERLAQRFSTLSVFLVGVGVASAGLAAAIGILVFRHGSNHSGLERLPDLLIGAAVFSLLLQMGLVSTLLKAQQRFAVAGRLAVLTTVLTWGALFAAAQICPGPTALLAANAAVCAIVFLVGRLTVRTEARCAVGAGRWRLQLLREMARFGQWATVSRLSMLAVLQVDRLMVALLGSVSNVTFYAVPAMLAQRVNTVGGPLQGLFFARASRLHSSTEEAELVRQFNLATRFALYFTLPILVPMVAMGRSFLALWIGADMARNGFPVLVLLAVGYAVQAVSAPSGAVLDGCVRPDLSARCRLAWTIIAGGLLVVLSSWGGWVIVAVVLSVWLTGVGMTDAILARRLLAAGERVEWRPWGQLCAGIAAALLAAAVVPQVAGTLNGVIGGLGVAGGATAGVGFAFILTQPDRALVAASVRRNLPSLRRASRTGRLTL